MSLERQIGHGVAQRELAHLDAIVGSSGRQQQLVEPFNQLALLILHPGRADPFQLDGERKMNGGQENGGCLCRVRSWCPFALFGGLGAGLVVARHRSTGLLLVSGRLLGGFGCAGGCRVIQRHLQVIEHRAAYDQPLAVEGGADIEGSQRHGNTGYRQIEVSHLETVDLNFEGERMPDKRLRRLFRGRLRVRHLDHRMSHFKRFDPEFALQQLAKIPVEHGAIHRYIHQLILPAGPFQGPAIAKLTGNQLPLEGRQRPFGLLPQPLVALMGKAQQADTDEQQEHQPHQPEKNAF